MSAATLIYNQLATVQGYTVMPDLRNAAQELTSGVIVIYEIKSEDMLDAISPSISIWKSSIDVYILAATLKDASDTLKQITTDINGITWSHGGETAFTCKTVGASHGYLEESTPGAADRTRYSILNLLLFHQN